MITSKLKLVTSAALFLLATQAYAFYFPGHAVIQVGAFDSYQGENQNVGIEGLIGDHFSVTEHSNWNALVGLGYYLDGYCSPNYNVWYGINAFYLFPTQVKGTITQEDLFTNLGYTYNISHIPLYAAIKVLFNNLSTALALTFDAGIGVNFMMTGSYHDYPLNDFTIPDNAFSGQTNTTFSATVGLGVRLNNVYGSSPLECGYRFFYLGNGNLQKNKPQLLSTLNTGNSYANAIVCSLSS